jgi:hypothetical protein
MAELGGVTINVGIEISEETVGRCCQILQMYLADHPDKFIASQKCGEYTDVCIYDRKNTNWCPICQKEMGGKKNE